MPAKMGRPTDDPKPYQLVIRVNAESMRMLDECTKRLNLTKSEVIRKGIELAHDDVFGQKNNRSNPEP